MDPVASFTFDSFQATVGEGFRLPQEQLELELVSATYVGSGADTRPGGAFTLLFRGPGNPALTQGTRSVSHHELGDFALFLVPVADGAGHSDYEAVFA